MLRKTTTILVATTSFAAESLFDDTCSGAAAARTATGSTAE
jgi:hypothetical protein